MGRPTALIPIWVKDLAVRGPRGLLAWQAVTSAVGIFLSSALMALYLLGPAGLDDGIAALTLLGSAALCLLATPPASRIIRAIGARRFAILSCLSRGIIFMILPLSLVPAWTIVIVLLAGLCEAAAFSVYQIIIADALGEKNRTEALAVRRTLGNIGFTIGGLGVAAVVGLGSTTAYAAGFIASGVALALASLFLVPIREVKSSPPITAGGELKGNRRSALRDPRFIGLIALASVMASSLHLLTVGVPLWLVRETAAPDGIVGLLLVINTVLVVLFQVRLSRRAETWSGARRAVIFAGLAFAVSVTLVAVAGFLPTWAAVVALILAAVVAAVAEMWDSAGWWTLSYEYAGPQARPDYLAAFDVVTPIISMAGPPLMIAIVAAGTSGWLVYALVFPASSAVAAPLLTRKLR